jgi:hypothetical protein
MSNEYQDLNFSSKTPKGNQRGVDSPATIGGNITAGTAKAYSLDGTGDGLPPRSLVAQGAGDVVVTGWDDATVTFAALAGQVIPFMPKTISASTAVAVVALW